MSGAPAVTSGVLGANTQDLDTITAPRRCRQRQPPPPRVRKKKSVDTCNADPTEPESRVETAGGLSRVTQNKIWQRWHDLRKTRSDNTLEIVWTTHVAVGSGVLSSRTGEKKVGGLHVRHERRQMMGRQRPAIFLFVCSVDRLDHGEDLALPERQDFVVVRDLFRHYVSSKLLARASEEVPIVSFLANERLELT